MQKLKNFNYIKSKNPNKKYVDNIKKVWWKLNKGNELDRITLHRVLEIFLHDCIVPKKEKALDKDKTKYTIKPDYLITLKDIKEKFLAWNKKKNFIF